MTLAQLATGAPQRSAGNIGDDDYRQHLARLEASFRARVGTSQLFCTDAEGIWEAYLGSFPQTEQQFHTCNACRHFVQRFGHLVIINESGETVPAMWDADDAQGQELAAIAAMERVVRRAKVTGPFLSSDKVWGQPITGTWRHMAVLALPQAMHTSRVLTAGQAMAEKREDFKNVRRALAEFTAPMVEQALGLLKSDALYRSEKVLGQAQWLSDLHAALEKAPKRFRDNVLWRFVGAAPAGFCHPRSSMIGTLLEDIAAGVSFEVASRKFAEKMHPLRYQRPQAPPSSGAILAAEKLVEKLGIARSLERRFARLEEVTLLWRPAALHEATSAAGVFGHLKAKGAAPAPSMVAPPQSITWVKFAAEVLPSAEQLEAQVGYGPMHFFAYLTAAHLDAPPILQWDAEGARNPISWYTYHGGSIAGSWNLGTGWTRVTGLALAPWAPDGKFGHMGKGATLFLEGCRDTRIGQGNALFPETLKSELHGVRATIEAYSKSATIAGAEEATACGLSAIGTVVRVTGRAGVVTQYKIDRWD